MQNPYFMLDLLVGRDAADGGTVMDPSEEIFRYVFATLQSMWEENLDAIKPLLSDPYFHSFTKYETSFRPASTLIHIDAFCFFFLCKCLFPPQAHD